VGDGNQPDDWKERAMQSQPTSLILLAEARHAELQHEAAQERLAGQALTTRFSLTSMVVRVGSRVGVKVAGALTLLHDGLTFMRARQRTTLG
jgi:hypothetical protein